MKRYAHHKHTHICTDTIEYGKCSGACGGETVKNIGEKNVGFVSGSGTIHKYDFQVGDKITKPLLAVSKVCESKKGVFFGPAPEYRSYIIDDPHAFMVGDELTDPKRTYI